MLRKHFFSNVKKLLGRINLQHSHLIISLISYKYDRRLTIITFLVLIYLSSAIRFDTRYAVGKVTFTLLIS